MRLQTVYEAGGSPQSYKMKKLALLNDTRTQFHHGCELVLKQIEKKLYERNVSIHSVSMEGTEWDKNTTFKTLASECSGIVVNGEGTIHHGRQAGKKLLQVANYAEEIGIPCFLINTTYQSNPVEYGNFLKKFKRIYVRETKSREELEKIKICSVVVPDITLSYEFNHSNDRNGFGVSDSAMTPLSEVLYNYCKHYHGQFMPVIRSRKNDGKVDFVESLRHVKFKVNNFILKIKNDKNYLNIRNFYISRSIDHYLSDISKKEYLISGRFHVTCFCLLTETPFFALEGNSHKMQSMLEDIGVDLRRGINIENVEEIIRSNDFKFSEKETKLIKEYKRKARDSINNMFDVIANDL